MKYGEALKIVFEAFYKDRSAVDTTYTTPNLKDAVKTLPPQWKAQIMGDFRVIAREIEQNILSCPHDQSARVVPYINCEQCSDCGCKRFYELEQNDPMSWDDTKKWSDWKPW